MRDSKTRQKITIWHHRTTWQRYCMALQYWASAKLCGVEMRAPPIFARAAITLGIGPQSSWFFCLLCITTQLYHCGSLLLKQHNVCDALCFLKCFCDVFIVFMKLDSSCRYYLCNVSSRVINAFVRSISSCVSVMFVIGCAKDVFSIWRSRFHLFYQQFSKVVDGFSWNVGSDLPRCWNTCNRLVNFGPLAAEIGPVFWGTPS